MSGEVPGGGARPASGGRGVARVVDGAVRLSMGRSALPALLDGEGLIGRGVASGAHRPLPRRNSAAGSEAAITLSPEGAPLITIRQKGLTATNPAACSPAVCDG